MGQRSQIYIRIWDKDNDNPKLYAKYYGWNFGERMISRAKHGIEYIKTHLKYIDIDSTQEKINRIFDVNFDMQDILLTSDIIKEWLEEDRGNGVLGLNTIMSEPLLEELIMYNDKGNFDRVMSLCQLMLYKEQLYRYQVKEHKEIEKKNRLFDKPIFSRNIDTYEPSTNNLDAMTFIVR